MHRILTTTALIAAAYSLTAWIAGPTQLAHTLITLTAIDHWHPNWPDPTTVNATARALPTITAAIAVTLLAMDIALKIVTRNHSHALPRAAVTAPMDTTALPSSHVQTREGFGTHLRDSLTAAGVAPDQAGQATDAALALADTGDPRDWAGRVRGEALALAGLTGPFLRLHSQDPHLTETAKFLTGYGYPTVHLAKASGPTQGDRHVLDFDGLAVQHRTTAHDAEEALIELLVVAHQAHLASMADNGYRAQAGRVDQAAHTLRHVATKLALRGFVPPEIDAQIGHPGVATANELEQWAIAQVVAACSPMTSAPLPTTSRDVATTKNGSPQ